MIPFYIAQSNFFLQVIYIYIYIYTHTYRYIRTDTYTHHTYAQLSE